jgi:hypothetical protein
VTLNAIPRRVLVRRGHRDVLGLGNAQQRGERAIRGDVAAVGIVRDRDRHRRGRDQSLERTQPLPELVGVQRIDSIESRSVQHGPGAGDTRYRGPLMHELGHTDVVLAPTIRT